MRKLKELFLEHKAIGVGLSLVLILILVDGGIFAYNFMHNQNKLVEQPQEQQQTKQPEQQQQQQPEQQPEQQQQQNNSNSGSRTVTCNQAAANNYTNQYSASVDAENARHNSAIASIQNGPEIYPGYKQIALAQENARYNQNLTTLYNQYQANLRSVNC